MNQYKILEHEPLAKGVYRLKLEGDTSKITRAGQFVNIKLPNFYLRRPISIAHYDETTITLIYKVLGEGTEQMTALSLGSSLDMLVGLGNGFDLSVEYKQAVLVGGGVGVPPLYRLALELSAKGQSPIVVLGFNRAEDIFYLEEFSAIPRAKVYIATMDGSVGQEGTVLDVFPHIEEKLKLDYIYACGPTPMLQALHKLGIRGQFSLEERMGCGFGACMGCTHKMNGGYKRVCHEGPVFTHEQLLW